MHVHGSVTNRLILFTDGAHEGLVHWCSYQWAERNTHHVPGVLILSQVQAWNISKCATGTRASFRACSGRLVRSKSSGGLPSFAAVVRCGLPPGNNRSWLCRSTAPP